MKDIFPKAALNQLSTYVAIIVIFIYNVVLDKNLDCSCKRQAWVCNLYLILPFFILFILQLCTDKTFQRAWKYTCTCTCTGNCCNGFREKRCKFFWFLLYHIIKAVFIGLLWVVSVLMDGDWYVCCHNDHSEKQKQLACKDKKNITLEEHTIIAELKHTSWGIGISLLSCALFVATVVSSFAWRNCCKKKCDRKLLYYKVILDEEKKVLKEILTTAAKEKLTKDVKSKISDEQWETCFDVATELIEKNTGPGAAGANQEQQREQEQPEQQREQEQPGQQREQEQPEQQQAEQQQPVQQQPVQQQPEQQREQEQPEQKREQEQPEQKREQEQPEQKREQEQQPQGSDEEEEGPEEKGGVPERSSTKLQMQPLMQNKE